MRCIQPLPSATRARIWYFQMRADGLVVGVGGIWELEEGHGFVCLLSSAARRDASPVASMIHCVSSLLHGEIWPSATMWKATHGCGANLVESSRVSLLQFSCFLGRFAILSMARTIIMTRRSPSGNHIISVSGWCKFISSSPVQNTPVLPFRQKTHQILSLRLKNSRVESLRDELIELHLHSLQRDVPTGG